MPEVMNWVRATGPSAGLVREHFVKKRMAELDRIAPGMEKRLEKRINAYLENSGKKTGKHGLDWIAVYQKLTENLQSRDLTINFKAETWFAQENTYASYAQMYERAPTVKDASGKEKLFLQSAGTNPAATRAAADDTVTFPLKWKNDTDTHRGLRPGVRSGQALMNQMAFGTHKPHSQPSAADPTKTETGIISDNAHFNAKSKQLFSALNFAQRPHGSCTLYGRSYMVLSDRFKVNALYFFGDTFLVAANAKAADQAVSYQHLGALIGAKTTSDITAGMLLKAAYEGVREADDPTGFFIIEAHLFEELNFTGNIKEIVLAVNDVQSVVAQNARKFAKKHGAKLIFTTP